MVKVVKEYLVDRVSNFHFSSAVTRSEKIIFYFQRVFPESIRYFLIKGKTEKAERVLQKVAKYNRKPNIEEKLEQPEEEQKSSFKDLFSTPEMRKYTLLSWFIW